MPCAFGEYIYTKKSKLIKMQMYNAKCIILSGNPNLLEDLRNTQTVTNNDWPVNTYKNNNEKNASSMVFSRELLY